MVMKETFSELHAASRRAAARDALNAAPVAGKAGGTSDSLEACVAAYEMTIAVHEALTSKQRGVLAAAAARARGAAAARSRTSSNRLKVPEAASMPWSLVSSAREALAPSVHKSGGSAILVPFPELMGSELYGGDNDEDGSSADAPITAATARRQSEARARVRVLHSQSASQTQTQRSARSDTALLSPAMRGVLLLGTAPNGISAVEGKELGADAKGALRGKLFDLHAGVSARSEGNILTPDQRAALLTCVSELPPPVEPPRRRRHSAAADLPAPPIAAAIADAAADAQVPAARKRSLPELPPLDAQLGLGRVRFAAVVDAAVSSSPAFAEARASADHAEARAAAPPSPSFEPAAVEGAAGSSQKFVARRAAADKGEAAALAGAAQQQHEKRVASTRSAAFGRSTA